MREGRRLQLGLRLSQEAASRRRQFICPLPYLYEGTMIDEPEVYLPERRLSRVSDAVERTFDSMEAGLDSMRLALDEGLMDRKGQRPLIVRSSAL